jgi:hypothetical protein
MRWRTCLTFACTSTICTVDGAVQIGDCGPVVQPLGHGVASYTHSSSAKKRLQSESWNLPRLSTCVIPGAGNGCLLLCTIWILELECMMIEVAYKLRDAEWMSDLADFLRASAGIKSSSTPPLRTGVHPCGTFVIWSLEFCTHEALAVLPMTGAFSSLGLMMFSMIGFKNVARHEIFHRRLPNCGLPSSS